MDSAPPRAVVSWEGPGEPIVLTLHGPDGETVSLPLLPVRALTLAQELLTRGVQAIKADSWDAMYEPGAPQRAPGLGGAQFDPPMTSHQTTPNTQLRDQHPWGGTQPE